MDAKEDAILPGRGHAGDRVEENKARRELDALLYSSHADAGVNLHPRFEEARYVNEVIGAMLIWIHRIFLQHNVLVRDPADALCRLGRGREAGGTLREDNGAAKGRSERAAEEERSSILAREASMVIVSKPTELTTVDKVGSTVAQPAQHCLYQWPHLRTRQRQWSADCRLGLAGAFAAAVAHLFLPARQARVRELPAAARGG